MINAKKYTLLSQVTELLSERGPRGATVFELISIAKGRGNEILGKASETAVRDCLKAAGPLFKARNENLPISDGATTAQRIQRYWLATVAPEQQGPKRRWVREDLDEIINSHVRAAG